MVGHHGKRSAARRCAFCHNDIEPGAPREHVLPKWIGREYRHARFSRRDSEGRLLRSSTIDVTVDTVCRACNQHWMSDLETRASPILKPMLKGQRQGLTVEHQVLLAQWAAKTAMTLDQTFSPRERVYALATCKELMERRFPPVGTGVQLGHYKGDGDFIQVVHNDLHLRPVPVGTPPGPPQGIRTAVRIDKLILEVNSPENDAFRIHSESVKIEDVLTRIWPSAEAVVWPPRYAFGDQLWEAFTVPETEDRDG